MPKRNDPIDLEVTIEEVNYDECPAEQRAAADRMFRRLERSFRDAEAKAARRLKRKKTACIIATDSGVPARKLKTK